MLRRYIRLFEQLTNLGDGVLAFGAYWSSYYLYLDNNSGNFEQKDEIYSTISIIVLVTWFLLSKVFLTPSRRFYSFLTEIKSVLYINMAGILFTSFILYIFQVDGFNRNVFIIFGILSFISSIIGRIFIRKFLEYSRGKGKNKKFVIIIGDGPKAEDIHHYFKDNQHLGIETLGYLNDSINSRQMKYLGNIDSLETILHEQVVDCVFILIPLNHPKFNDCMRICDIEGKETKIVVSELDNLSNFNKSVSDIFGNPVISIDPVPNREYDIILKRSLDIIASGIGLLVLSPVFLMVALIIKLEDANGPVFFTQKRVGLNGRLFSIYKFRSMVSNAEELKASLMAQNEMSGPAFKMKNDPRITRIGRFIRKTSIDELPQLLNVFLGDMSLVGPRPPLPNEVAEYENGFRRRLTVKPGITCIWQISGRNEIDFDQWMELDMQYIDNWSFGLDLKILFKTIPVVLFGKGAS